MNRPGLSWRIEYTDVNGNLAWSDPFFSQHDADVALFKLTQDGVRVWKMFRHDELRQSTNGAGSQYAPPCWLRGLGGGFR
jgi:hypothetical protein